jgi:hypothetical protein
MKSITQITALIWIVLPLWLGCATNAPRVGEVSCKRYEGNATNRGQEYFVSWKPASVQMVKFEYRQVHAPNKVFEKTFIPGPHAWTVFQVPGEDLVSGGPVSAWRVSLWAGTNTCVAEKKSALW